MKKLNLSLIIIFCTITVFAQSNNHSFFASNQTFSSSYEIKNSFDTVTRLGKIRTSATLPDGNKWNYTYDVMGLLTGAVKQDTANNPLTNMNYFYDLIGNRTSATENSATTTYTSNIVNQYTAVNAVIPVYDLDGNMTSYNGWTYTYNGENRLIVAENAAAGVRVEADYDYMGRRLFKKVYNNNTLTKHAVFVYDGFKQIAEFDALNNNSLKANYLWQPVGLDIVLLRNSEYLIADGNKNIIQVRNATGSVTDSYIYDPFGKVTHNGSSENPFQFSSEFFDDETELVYYNYRYYVPNLGRWINRDPIEEDGGKNLCAITQNNTIDAIDINGLAIKYKKCNEQQKKIAGSAIKEAKRLADKAYNWIYPPASDKKNKVTFRYVKYFGKYNKDRVEHVRNTYSKISRKLNDITVNCCCSEKQTYAYVYQNDGQYEITLCNLFWQASTSGFDSQSGVFIHEMAHEVNNKIDDKEGAGHSPYGVNNALFYAEKFPWTAVYNADNYTYFAEACR